MTKYRLISIFALLCVTYIILISCVISDINAETIVLIEVDVPPSKAFVEELGDPPVIEAYYIEVMDTVPEESTIAIEEYYAEVADTIPEEEVEMKETLSVEETTVVEPPLPVYPTIIFDDALKQHTVVTSMAMGVDPKIIFAVMRKESNFNVNAIGDGGDSIGIMQIQPRWWSKMAQEHGLNIHIPQDNITLGIMLIKRQIDIHNGDVARALTAYNSGRGDHINGYALTILNYINEMQ